MGISISDLGKAIGWQHDVAIVAAEVRRHVAVIHHLRQELRGPNVHAHAQRPRSLPRNEHIVARELQRA